MLDHFDFWHVRDIYRCLQLYSSPVANGYSIHGDITVLATNDQKITLSECYQSWCLGILYTFIVRGHDCTAHAQFMHMCGLIKSIGSVNCDCLIRLPLLSWSQPVRLTYATRQASHDLTLKAPITTAADDIHKYFFIIFRENKTWCFKWIHMKN